MTKPLRLTVLISGGGTTLRNLLDHIRDHQLPATIDLVISSNPKSVGLKMAEANGISTAVITTQQFKTPATFSDQIFDAVRKAKSDYVICAGFLKRLQIPKDFINRVVNIHPGLIPAFCGAGMYGKFVHEAAIDQGAKISGCTVHFVDDQYDHGPIISQRAVPVMDHDTAASLAARVFAQECELYPAVIRWLAEGRVNVQGQQVSVT